MEWLRSDLRRTAVGVDLDLEALQLCLEHNVNMHGSDVYFQITLLHGYVLQPTEASLVEYKLDKRMENMTLNDIDKSIKNAELAVDSECTMQIGGSAAAELAKKVCKLRDIVCAFNYSCCCLQKRADLVFYFKHALSALSKIGGIFIMDLYGGTSSKCILRFQRRYPNFKVVMTSWKKLVSNLYVFGSEIRKMPDTQESHNAAEFCVSGDVKYEEVGFSKRRTPGMHMWLLLQMNADHYSTYPNSLCLDMLKILHPVGKLQAL